ncbi:MAG: PIG-L family deacetylase [Kofleriaceae bacterium]
MMRTLVAACMMFATPALAETNPGAAELAHALDRLGTTGRVLYIAAHPDDENTSLLTYLANIKHLEVAYLSMTRGGGGQNLIGGEQGALLDVVRTEELLAARRIDHARQYFTRMRDFGYSKRADETVANWTHDAALADVVWVIRTFQPDVIITRFSEDPPNHGHHTASAILAREAFTAAADPKRFPEQLRDGVTPWQTVRLFRNHASWGRTPAPPPKTAIAVDVGAYDPRLGLGMGELAARSRSQHKSQGFGVAEQRGKDLEYFVPIAGKPATRDLFEGIAIDWSRHGAAATSYAKAIADAQRTLERDHPERALPALARAHAELAKLGQEPRVRDARIALDEVLAAAAGLYVRATSEEAIGVPGGKVSVTLELATRGPAARIRSIDLPGAAPIAAIALAAGDNKLVTTQVALPAQARPTIEYWLEQPAQPGHYTVADPRLIGAPRRTVPLAAVIEVQLAGRVVRLVRPVVHAWTDRVHGERVRPFTIVPPVTVTPLRQAVLSPGGKAGPLDVRVRAGRDGITGRLELALPAGWIATPASHALTLAKAGDEITLRFAVRPRGSKAAAGEATPVARIGAESWSLREDVIDYPHIPMQLVLRPAVVRLVPIELVAATGRIGYVRGSGDSIAADLAHVGYTVEELDDEMLRSGDLRRYTAIVLGIRAHNTRPAIGRSRARLDDYIKRGGTLVVQYNTLDFEGALGPFPLELGRDRITDETATPTLLDPKHPLLTRPHVLAAPDFVGWIQERGIYFASKWDARYKPLLRFTDPGEAPLDGALVVATHGKGRFIYTGLALFRQLPAGVPGAYRLFANLLAGAK